MIRKHHFHRLVTVFTENFGMGRGVAIAAISLIGTVFVVAIFLFIRSAPPSTLIISAGPDNSLFETNAVKYSNILARSGVKLKIIKSNGSLQNLENLQNPRIRVDVGFVQGGLTNGASLDKLVSLGSVFNEPLMIFYRSETPLSQLSQFEGKYLAVGPPGSGTRSLATTLLATNGITAGGDTTMLDEGAEDATKGLLSGSIDAIFLMGDSASPQVIRKLLRAPGIHLFSFAQADGYVRRFTYLNKLQIPMGSIDFGKNIPPEDTYLIGPTVELIARSDLHPAVSDLLLDAMREVHGRASLLQHRGEFPAPLENEFRISPDAARYYKTGKSFLYRSLGMKMASFIDRALVVLLPSLVFLIPALRLIPTVYRWRIRLKLLRWYRALLSLEREVVQNRASETLETRRQEFVHRLNHIEQAVNHLKVPASFGDQFYGLRGHIDFVRDRLAPDLKV